MNSPTLILKRKNSQNGVLSPTRVLIIDDDADTTDLLKVFLTPEFQVFTCNSAVEGIQRVRNLQPDVIILDLMMPDMDGLDVCTAIREFSNIPILVVSAISKPEVSMQALDRGADDFLLKPVKSKVLIAHLNKLLRRK
jgi:two-component system KDP operon response regulator KdpE